MTKKDYVLIAEVIAKMTSLGADQEYVADLFAAKLARENPKFDTKRFLKACGIED
jgi:hypothetical protein